MIGPHLITFGLEEDLERLDDVFVVIHEGDGSHKL
jgi:predicted short-subunit dehydrogenase-like oxidoreductase (DUF2520 family)